MVLSYDDETSVGMKADYVKSRGLKGAMYWNIEADDASWTLSKAISTRLLKDENETGEAYLVTNKYMQDFMDQVQYRDRDYSYTLIYNFPGGGPGEADIPPSVYLKWSENTEKGPLTLRVWDNEWSREYKLESGSTKQELVNLVPGSHYDYMVTNSSGDIVDQGSFDTTGSIHQVYFSKKVRNSRD